MRVGARIGGNIQVLNADVNNAVRIVFEEAANEQVAPAMSDRCQSRHSADMDHRLTPNSTGGEGCGRQGTKLITDFIMAEDYNTPLNAVKGMVSREGGITAVTDAGETGWVLAVSEAEGVTELAS